MRSIDLNARVYQVNHLLRKLGLTPTPPGHIAIKDRAKMTALGVFAKGKPDIKSDVTFSGITRFKQLFKKLSSN
jgi:hypothetical protein